MREEGEEGCERGRRDVRKEGVRGRWRREYLEFLSSTSTRKDDYDLARRLGWYSEEVGHDICRIQVELLHTIVFFFSLTEWVDLGCGPGILCSLQKMQKSCARCYQLDYTYTYSNRWLFTNWYSQSFQCLDWIWCFSSYLSRITNFSLVTYMDTDLFSWAKTTECTTVNSCMYNIIIHKQ